MAQGRVKRSLWIIAGTLSMCIGAVGIVVPLLPTTPFLLLAAACYANGSERIHRWLLQNRVLGAYIRSYHSGEPITRSYRAGMITLLWATMAVTAILFLKDWQYQLLLVIIGAVVTVHLLTIGRKRTATVD